jgi:hypothetical protein
MYYYLYSYTYDEVSSSPITQYLFDTEYFLQIFANPENIKKGYSELIEEIKKHQKTSKGLITTSQFNIKYVPWNFMLRNVPKSAVFNISFDNYRLNKREKYTKAITDFKNNLNRSMLNLIDAGMVNGPLYYQEFIRSLLMSLPYIINYSYSPTYRTKVDDYLKIHATRNSNIVESNRLFSNIFLADSIYGSDPLIKMMIQFYIVVKNKLSDTISLSLIQYIQNSTNFNFLTDPANIAYLKKIKKIDEIVFGFYLTELINHNKVRSSGSSKKDYDVYYGPLFAIQREFKFCYAKAGLVD